MNTLKNFICLIFIITSFSSCDLFHHNCPPDIDSYMLALCFQDSFGNNITENIDTEELIIEESENDYDAIVKPDLYSLFISIQNYIDGEIVPGPDDYPALYSSNLIMGKNENVGNCFIISFSQFKENNNVRKLTYKLQCPSIFGDAKTHEFVTYWELNDNIYAQCYLIEYEGHKIIPQTFENKYYSLGIIKLDYVH